MKGKEMRNLRRELGLSQFKLEQISSVSRNKIALYEQGYRTISSTELDQIQIALDTEMKRISTERLIEVKND